MSPAPSRPTNRISGKLLRIALILLAVVACHALSAHSQTLPLLPITHATSLDGASVTLPDAFAGRPGVLVLGFSKDARDAVAAWGRRLAADYRTDPGTIYFEAAMLAGAPRFVRGMIVRAMKSSVPDRAQPRFLVLTDDEDRWRTLARFGKSHPDDPYILVIDATGAVRSTIQGTATDATYTTVKQQLESLRSHK